VTPNTPGRRVADRPVDSDSMTLELAAIQAEAVKAAYVGKRMASVPTSPEVQSHQAEVVSDDNVERVLASLEPVDQTTSLEHEDTARITMLREEPEPVPTTYVTSPTPGEPTIAGKRRAVRHASTRGPLFRRMPSAPVLLGIAALAVSIGGVLTVTDPEPVSAAAGGLTHASALSGSSGIGSAGGRDDVLSRDSDRTAQGNAAGEDLQAAAEGLAEQRAGALAQYASKAEQYAKVLAKDLWQYPLSSVNLTARFGQYGLWSSYHTGLDFNGNTGDPIVAIASGVVTEASYDGSYGNKTVITLEDGTEIWYCHQTTFNVSVGDTVRGGELIGTVGATGHVTGSHLHVEVRPGGGDPVDPYLAMQQHGLFR
jgi:Peptidase family M23